MDKMNETSATGFLPDESGWGVLLLNRLFLYPSLAVLAFAFVLHRSVPVLPAKSPRHWTKDHWPIIGSSVPFFSRRRDAMLQGLGTFPTGNFSFFVGQKHVVAVSGAEGRQVFFENRNLSLAQGFVDLLTGKLPSAKNEKDYGLHNLIKPLLHLTRSEELTKRIPRINQHIATYCNSLQEQKPSPSDPEWRVMKVFDKLPLFMFKVMQQCVGFQEIAEDDGLLRRTFAMYRRFENTTSQARIMFPWLVTPRHIWRLIMATVLYIDLSRLLSRRTRNKEKVDDAVQFLLDKGESAYDVVEFIFSVFVAGLTTTTFTCSWLLIYLSHFPEWMVECRKEIDALVEKHRSGPEQSASELVSAFTLQDWESGLPVMGMCLRETLRLQLPGVMFRRNTGAKDIPIGQSGEVIPAGSYAAYTVADAHRDGRMYQDPESFNPGRYLEKDDYGSHTYLGWGSGRHVCAGMRLAKLLITMVTVHMLVHFDVELSGREGGENTDGLPEWDRNALRMEVTDQPIYLRYRPRL